jgi:hypothetical protein
MIAASRYRARARRVPAIAAALVLALDLASAVARADDVTPPDVVYPTLAAQAADAAGFAPAGWQIETKLAGDLNGDKIDDLVLVLREHDPANLLDNPDGPGDAKLDTNPRILAVALGRAGGGYDLAVANHTLIPRTTESNLDDFLEPDAIAIKRGALHVRLHLFANAGGWGTSNPIFTFRLQHGTLELIGYDSSSVNRGSGAVTDVSVNYASGKLKLSTGSIEDDALKVRWKTLPKRPPLTIDQIGNGIEFDPDHPPQ